MKRIEASFRSLQLVKDTPERTALAFSLGVCVGFSPFLGLHTLLGLLIAFAFRLNKTAVLLGVFLNNPWVVVPFYSFSTWVGIGMMGLPEGVSLPDVGFFDLLQKGFWTWLFSQWRLLIPVFVGSSLLSIILSLLAYVLAVPILRRYTGNKLTG